MTTILILYAIGAVATYGWAVALEPPIDRYERWVIYPAACACWPLLLPVALYERHRNHLSVWRGWRIR